MEQAVLSKHEYALYGKLHVSRDDIDISSLCAVYIRKKGWHTCSFLRRGTVRIQQASFTTTMIVAYARPFAPGRGNIGFPKRLLGYNASDENIFHQRLLRLRHTEYAHLDALCYSVTPYKGGSVKSIENIRDVYFTEKEIELFMFMTDGLLGRITERMEQLRLGA